MKPEFDIGTAGGRLMIRAGNTHYDPKIGDPFASDIVTHYRLAILDAHNRGRREGMEEAAAVYDAEIEQARRRASITRTGEDDEGAT